MNALEYKCQFVLKYIPCTTTTATTTVVVVVEISSSDVQSDSDQSPLLLFCTSLMSTVDAFQSRPNQLLSVECVRAALNHSRIDLLTHWISQHRYDSTLTCLHCVCY